RPRTCRSAPPGTTARLRSELRENLSRLGEAMLLLLREQKRLAVEHVELALRAGHCFSGPACLRSDLGRETRGPFVVPASDGAVEDADLAHGASLTAAWGYAAARARQRRQARSMHMP